MSIHDELQKKIAAYRYYGKVRPPMSGRRPGPMTPDAMRARSKMENKAIRKFQEELKKRTADLFVQHMHNQAMALRAQKLNAELAMGRHAGGIAKI